MKEQRAFLHYSIFGVVLLGITIGSSEAVLRLSGQVATETVHTVSADDYDRIPGMFEPGQNVTEVSHPQLAYHVTINSLGYRGPEINRVKPTGVIRILCLGDSGTYGQFVNDDETVTAYLEEFLRREHRDVEVVNAGVPGTTIIDQVQFLQRSMVIDPDLVIITFSENDIMDMLADPPQAVALARNRQLKSRPGLKELYAIVRDTALFNYALRLKATWAARVLQAPSMPNAEAASLSQYERAWQMYAEELRAMKKYLADRRVPLLFNVFPTHHRIGKDTLTDKELQVQLPRAEAMARAQGIRTIEILPVFLQSGLGKTDLYLLPYDGHANKRGYRLQAEALLPSLRELVRPTPAP
jgi:lysophospholipase L1-like esterase